MTMVPTSDLEERRIVLQRDLDTAKDQSERNRRGQFATPSALAVDILRHAHTHHRDAGVVRFIDPALGTGAFYSALLNVFPKCRIGGAIGYEIDAHYGTPAAKLWEHMGLDVQLRDFTLADPPPEREKFDLVICNPPYVRHHHIVSSEKQRLRGRVWKACAVDINGLAGLYCYFIGLSHAWMAEEGLAGWLIPSEFMDVNYGASLKSYLLNRVTLLHIHRFDPTDVQFGDALVSSAVVWFRKRSPSADHAVRFTYGGSLAQPTVERLVTVETLRREPKWTRYPLKDESKVVNAPVLSDFFTIKRGLATGDNRYFILPVEVIERRRLPTAAFRPILPSPRYLPDDEVMANHDGHPLLDRRLFLLDCRLNEQRVREMSPTLWAYLEDGKAHGVHERYICRHRKPWYAQEDRPPAPFVCTYLGRSDTKRGRPFRFILNNSLATAANVYLMLYPKPVLARAMQKDSSLKRQVWRFLNDIHPESILDEGRVYGGGLHKLEPKELGNVPVPGIAEVLPDEERAKRFLQAHLFEMRT
ncbi:MAG: Eco57I restriction-modification methylase domain-containing protein [Chloroflexota bacterium]|nr:Eco57I restriction-modification methylase domain-containing protein [Chloroflexota bacterium]